MPDCDILETGRPHAVTFSNSFNEVVNEANSAPKLTVPGTQTINELSSLVVSVSASDDDVPANPFTYSLVSPPNGMTITPSGGISWIPNENQGPSTNTINVVVTDNGAPPLSTTNAFTIIVNEVNTAPQLQAIVEQSVHFGKLLTVQPVATDSDVPANTLSYSIDQGPNGLTIDGNTGLISWTPAQSAVGKHTVVVRVTDNGVPAASGTNSFQITVAGEGSQLQIGKNAGLAQLTITGDINQNYELQFSTDLKTWRTLLQFQLTTSPYPYIDAEPATNRTRFYQLKLLP